MLEVVSNQLEVVNNNKLTMAPPGPACRRPSFSPFWADFEFWAFHEAILSNFWAKSSKIDPILSDFEQNRAKLTQFWAILSEPGAISKQKMAISKQNCFDAVLIKVVDAGK